MDDEKREKPNPVKQNVLEQKISEALSLSMSFLFAVLIGVTFFMFSEDLVPLQYDFKAIIIIAGFITVLVDMIGYLRTIGLRPYRNSKRFVLDLVLIYLFFQLMYSSFASFEFFLQMYVIIFSFYLVWTYFEYKEYKHDNTFRKTIKSSVIRKVVCVVIFVGIFIFNSTLINEENSCDGIPEEDIYDLQTCNFDKPSQLEWILLILVLSIVIGNKIVAHAQNEFFREPIIEGEP